MLPYAIFLFTIGASLIVAKFLSGLMEKLKVPGVLGEIFAGIIIGSLILFFPELKSYLDPTTSEFNFISALGIIFLLFQAGLQTDLRTLKETGKTATISTIGGVLVPLALGFLVVKTFGFDDKEAFGIGVILTATSIGITVRVMMDLGVLTSRVGTASLSASVIDDFIGIALVVLATGTGDMGLLLLNMLIFVIIALVFGWFLIDKTLVLFNKFSPSGLLAFCIGIMFLLSAFAEVAFQAAIEGAFIMGIIVSRKQKEIIEQSKFITHGFIAPLFFVHIGSIIDIRVFGQVTALFFAFSIVIVAIVGKVLGRGLFARISGFNWKESWQMGVGSIPRMEVALISLSVSINAGVFSLDHLQIAIAAAMVFVSTTTLITPSLLKYTFRNEIRSKLIGIGISDNNHSPKLPEKNSNPLDPSKK